MFDFILSLNKSNLFEIHIIINSILVDISVLECDFLLDDSQC